MVRDESSVFLRRPQEREVITSYLMRPLSAPSNGAVLGEGTEGKESVLERGCCGRLRGLPPSVGSWFCHSCAVRSLGAAMDGGTFSLLKRSWQRVSASSRLFPLVPSEAGCCAAAFRAAQVPRASRCFQGRWKPSTPIPLHVQNCPSTNVALLPPTAIQRWVMFVPRMTQRTQT